MVAGVVFVGAEDQKDRAPLVSRSSLESCQCNGIGTTVDAELKVPETSFLQLICQTLATDRPGIGKGEEAGVASRSSCGNGADDPKEDVIRQPIDPRFLGVLLQLELECLEVVVNRRAAYDHQVGRALFDIGNFDRFSPRFKPTVKPLRGRKDVRIVDENGQGCQVQAEVADIALAEDQLLANDNVIAKSDLRVENMKRRGIGASEIDRQIRVVPERFPVEAKIDTLGLEEFRTGPLETRADDQSLVVKVGKDNRLGSRPGHIEPLTVPTDQMAVGIEGQSLEESGRESRPEVDLGPPGLSLHLRYDRVVEADFYTNDRPGDGHLNRVGADNQTDQKREKMNH